MNLITDFLSDFVGSVAANVITGKGGESPGGLVTAQLKSRLFGLGHDDEAAVQLALAQLAESEPLLAEKAIARIKGMGDATLEDTPEARNFRQCVVALSEEQRPKLLYLLATLPEVGQEGSDGVNWQTFALATGGATAGMLTKMERFLRSFPENWKQDRERKSKEAAANLKKGADRADAAMKCLESWRQQRAAARKTSKKQQGGQP